MYFLSLAVICLVASADPAAQKTKDQAKKQGHGTPPRAGHPATDPKPPVVTVYGRAAFHVVRDGEKHWYNDGLKDVTLDPKTAGTPFVPKKKPPARLKP